MIASRLGRVGVAAILVVLGTLVVALAVAPPVGRAQQRGGAGEAPLVVERYRLPRASTTGVGDRIATIVRVDLSRYRFRFLSESHEGERRPLPQWVRDESLAGGINAGMFLPDGRSVGFLMQGGEVRSGRRPGSFDASIGFDPNRGAAPLAIGGPGCPTRLPGLRESHRSVLLARKLMIDCEGNARRWPNNRRYSSAAFGRDDEGRAVLIHVRTPYRMGNLSRMLAAPELGLRGLVYMEGGPEASLVVADGDVRVGETGSWEDGFNPNDTNREYWDLPNVIAFERR